MTTTVLEPAVSALPRPTRWHRPLLWFAGLMAVCTIAAATLALMDPREILGQNACFKPLKFAISMLIYSVSLSWMIGLFTRWRRVAWWAGTITAIALGVELVIIAGAAAVGTTSHFNVATPLNTTLWATMGGSIAVVWIAALVIAIALVLNPTGDRARDLALRAGVVLGIVGMAVAFFMTAPTSYQLDDFEGIAGAHAVGVPDGGAGIPFFGWSTEGGDLRVPHFIGMHALQILPLTALALELLARRVPLLRDPRIRFAFVALASALFAAVLGILTWQALAGQPIIAPAGPILVAGAATAALGVLAAAVITVVGLRSTRHA